jgi:hypothetical protein
VEGKKQQAKGKFFSNMPQRNRARESSEKEEK